MTDRNSEGVSIELLPLPVHNYVDGDGLWETAAGPYSAEETQAHALACVEHNVKKRDAEIEKLRAAKARVSRSLKEQIVYGNRQAGRAERLAEALLEVESELGPEVPLNHDSGNAVHRALSAAMAALNQEGGNPMSTGPTKWRAEHCTTHHHACDCREWEYACKIERLEAALEAAREDAARYRWLADNRCDVTMCASATDYGDGDTTFGPRVEIDPEQFGPEYGSPKAKLDAAIDAAREAHDG